MDRRELATRVLLALFALSGSALVAGLLAPHSSVTSLLIWAGLAGVAFSGLGLGGLALNVERRFLDPSITPAVLCAKTKGRTSLQISGITRLYAGKWLRAEGVVADVSVITPYFLWLLQLRCENTDRNVVAIFGRRWITQLASLREGDRVTVVGKIDKLEWVIRLRHAKIEHIDGPPPPDAPADT